MSQWKAALRIILAIVAKDISDSFHNQVVWTTLVTVLLAVGLYKALPVITSLEHLPQVVVYDAGDAALTTYLENSPTVEVRRVSSRSSLERFVAMEGMPALGLVIPAGLDRALAAGESLRLDGYVQHWAGEAAAAELEATVEQELALLAGQPAQIDLAGRIYPPLDSIGPHTWAALAIMIALTSLGLTLTPQLIVEEKRSHTLDALLVSPAQSGHVVAGKALTGLFYCLVGLAAVLAFNGTLIVQWGFAILAALGGSLLATSIGLLLGVTIQIGQSLRMWTLALVVPLFFLPAILSFMAMDLPPAVNAVVRWFPSVGLSRLFIMSMTERAPLAEWGPDIALMAGTSALILAIVAWRTGRSE